MINIQGANSIKIREKQDDIMILLDLDGVVANWIKGAANALHIDLNDKYIRSELKKGINLEKFIIGGEKALWEAIDDLGINFWKDLEKLSWADELVNMLREKSENFCFLTSPSNNPICAYGKIEWLKRHFGENFKNFLIGRDKHFCASYKSILIDDNIGKIKKFSKYGGNVFLWPKELSIIDEDIKIEDTLESLSKKIDKIKENLEKK